MRLACIMMVLWAGCTDGNAPPAFTQDQGVPDEGEPDLGMAEDLLAPSDLTSVDLRSVDLLPRPCLTACDCAPGDNCKSGFCETQVVSVFCCGTPACTGSNICETSSGKVSQCAVPDAGVRPDMGAGAACTSIACIPGIGSSAFCTVVCGQSATCSGTTNHCTP